MEQLIKRVEKLEEEVFGIAQGNYPILEECVWHLRDNVPVTSCRTNILLPAGFVDNISLIKFCTFCGKPIRAVK